MGSRRVRTMLWTLAAAGALGGCGETGGEGGSGGSGGSAGCQPTPVPCEDEIILDLNLQSTYSTRSITNTALADGWESVVDATAGGLNASEPFVYARFTDEGLSKRPITDEQALETDAWDLAFRRFVIRLNSGSSGPSCVEAAQLPPGTDYEDVDQPPDDSAFSADDFYSPSCEVVADTFGFNSPQTYLATFWHYPGCVAMTGNVYVVRTGAGRHVKLEVLAYYGSGQQSCDDTGAPGGDAANIRLRWAFLD